MKNILIFGATGDVGAYFVDYCMEQGNGEFNVIACGRRATDFFADKYGIDYYQVDIKKKSDFAKLPTDDIYAVVDFAGIMPARMAGYNPYEYIDVNINGTLNILEFCRENRVEKILFMQSFGDIKDYANTDRLLTVDLPPKFSFTSDHTVYVLSKNMAVDLIENYHQMYGLKNFIFRLPTIYLYSENDSYYVDGEIRKLGYRLLIDKAVKGEDIEVWGDGDRVKDMIYVKDFCQMLWKALLSDRDGGHYNAGTGIGTSLTEQIRGIIEVFGNPEKSRMIRCPAKPNAPEYIMDIKEAQRELGYMPNYSYIEMLKDFKKEMEERRFRNL